MPRFAIGQTIETREPTIVVGPGMHPGRHRFQLEVFDEAGNRSRPDTRIVEVRRDAVDSAGLLHRIVATIRRIWLQVLAWFSAAGFRPRG